MSIKGLRESTGLSQNDFARLFQIPVGTLRNWEQGTSNCPKYVYLMLHRITFDLMNAQYADGRQDLKLFSKINDSAYYTH